MRLYRVRKRLRLHGKFVEPGCVGCLKGLKPAQVDELLRVGAIAVVSSPPLSELPEWAPRAQKLAVGGIIDLADVVASDVETIAALAGVRPSTAGRWQARAETALTVTPEDGCCGG